MNRELVKEINELIDCDKKQNEFGGIIVVNRQFLIEVIALINELESENERQAKSKGVLLDNIQVLQNENQRLKDRAVELENSIKNDLQYAKGYGDGVKATVEVAYPKKLNEFAEMLKGKAIRRQEFIGELAIEDIEYVKTQDIDKTLKESINER